jgi:hypothetical protein
MCHASELAELPLSEASSPIRSKTGSGVLLDLLIILTLLVVGISFANEVPKQVEAAYPQSTRKWLPGGMRITPRDSPPQRLSLDAAERICFSKNHPH